MVLEVRIRREDGVERVDEVRVGDLAASLLVEARLRAVYPVPDRPVGVARTGVVGGPVLERRRVPRLEGADGEGAALRNPRAIRREPPAAALPLQKGVHGVQDAAPVSRQNQRRPLGLDGDAFEAEGVEIDLDAERLERRRTLADDDGRLRPELAFGHDRQAFAGHLLDVAGKVRCGVLLLRRRLLGDDDGVGRGVERLAAHGDGTGARRGTGLAGPRACGKEQAGHNGTRQCARESGHCGSPLMRYPGACSGSNGASSRNTVQASPNP